MVTNMRCGKCYSCKFYIKNNVVCKIGIPTPKNSCQYNVQEDDSDDE